MPKNPLGNWYDGIGTTHENSPNREAPNKHTKGSKKYREMIDKDSKKTDFWKNMPFTFSKPPKRTQARRDIFMVCLNCHGVDMVNKHTAGRVCSHCRKYTNVGPDNTYHTEEELVAALELLEAEPSDE